MDGLARLLRELTRQLMAFVLPGLVVLSGVVLATGSGERVLRLAERQSVLALILGYGLSLAVGFAVHAGCIVSFLKHSGRSLDEYSRWVGRQEAGFRRHAREGEVAHHARLVGYWQMSSGMVVAFSVAGLLLGLDRVSPIARDIALGVLGLVLLGLWYFGHRYMQGLVEAYETGLMEEGRKEDAAPRVVEQLAFEVDEEHQAQWLEDDARVWTSFLRSREGFAGKEVWRSVEDPRRLFVTVWWRAREDWQRVSKAQVEDTDAAMGTPGASPEPREYELVLRA